MTAGRGGRRTRRLLAAAVVACIVLAACSGDGDVSSERVDRIEPTEPSGPDEPATDGDRAGTPGSGDAGDRSSSATERAGTTETVPPDPTGLPSLGEPDPEILMGELDNGLRYVIRRNDNPGGRVQMRLVIDAGSAVQDEDQGGGAHFLEHMLFNGTEQFPANELVAVLRSFGAAFGADINARTTYDETVYELTVPTDEAAVVGTGLDVLEQWLTSALLDADEIAAERGVVLDEWRRSEESPSGRISDGIEALYLPGSDYEDRDPIGTEDDIRAIDRDALRRFYDDWYRPGLAAVVVVGDIDPGEIERGIAARFGPASGRSGRRERPEPAPVPETDPNAVVLADPDVTEGFVLVGLPLVVDGEATAEERAQREILEGLAFDIIATRLGDDALRGDASFDAATVSSRRFVRGLDSPEVILDVGGEDVAPAVQALVDEYERVRRHGVTGPEVERAVSARRRAAETAYDGRDTRQDADLAEAYVRHVLVDEPVPTADRSFDFVTAVLDRATPETIAHVFVDRWMLAVPQVLAVVPDDEATDAPSPSALEEIVTTAADRELRPRAEPDEAGESLMTPPEPVDPVAVETLAAGGIAPLVLTFPNGVRVGLTSTPVVEGSIDFAARSPGGLAMVADDDVPDAQAAATVVGRSGAGPLDPVALDAVLADAEVGLTPVIDTFSEGFEGFAATSDLETLLQLVHLTMTAPRVDDVALRRYVDDQLALAEDPSVDPAYAGLVALLDARYDDPRRREPTVESLGTVDAAGVEAVFGDRFGDASDFSFSVAGDIDVDVAVDLAARYLGTLPATGRIESPDVAEPPPPPGIVVEDVSAGAGARGNVSLLFTAPAAAERRVELVGDVVEQVVTNRLTDTIREELGESYSPFGVVELTEGAAPNAELFVSVSTDPDQLEVVSAAVLGELDDLRVDGPTDDELAAASAAVQRDAELISNPQVNDEVLRELTGEPGGSFAELASLTVIAASITGDEVAAALREWITTDRYIEIRVRPR